jgi:hypothetical protein
MVMTHTKLRRTNAEIKNTMGPIESCGGVRRLARMAISIVETSTSRKMQPYQAKYLSKKAKVSARCSGASQYCLYGRFIREVEVLAIVRGAKNPTETASTIRPAYNAKNSDFVSQPLGTPEEAKCEAMRFGSSGNSRMHRATSASRIAKKRLLGSCVPALTVETRYKQIRAEAMSGVREDNARKITGFFDDRAWGDYRRKVGRP